MARRSKEMIPLALRILVGSVLFYAGVMKVLDPGQFALDVDNFRLTSWPVSCALALYLPWLEILSGAALVLNTLRAGATLLAIAMLGTFLVALCNALARGLDITCGCFGQAAARPRLWQSLALDIALLIALGAAILIERDLLVSGADATAQKRRPG